MSDDEDEVTQVVPAHIRTSYATKEYAPINIALSELLVNGRLDLYPEVTGKRYFQVYLKEDSLVFQAGGFVGLIPINDRIAIDVHPRVPVRNFERLIRIAEHTPVSLAPHARRYGRDDEEAPSLLDLLADALLDSIDDIRSNGLYREYAQSTQDTSFPRGRILLAETLQRHYAKGVQHKVTASWFEQSADNALNQCIKYAIWYLAQRYKAMRPRKGLLGRLADLNKAYYLFAPVSLDKTRNFLKHSLVNNPETIPALRAYYKQAMYLATTIIQDRGIRFEGKGDEIVMASLLINVESLFEAYLRSVLRSSLSLINRNIAVLDGNIGGDGGGRKFLFDQGFNEDISAKTEASPDIVCTHTDPTSRDTKCQIVIDVKYKMVKDISERDDINQVVTYAASYRSPRVMLIHPQIDSKRHGLFILGHIGPLTIYQYMYNLSADNLEDEEATFTHHISELLKDTIS